MLNFTMDNDIMGDFDPIVEWVQRHYELTIERDKTNGKRYCKYYYECYMGKISSVPTWCDLCKNILHTMYCNIFIIKIAFELTPDICLDFKIEPDTEFQCFSRFGNVYNMQVSEYHNWIECGGNPRTGKPYTDTCDIRMNEYHKFIWCESDLENNMHNMIHIHFLIKTTHGYTLNKLVIFKRDLKYYIQRVRRMTKGKGLKIATIDHDAVEYEINKPIMSLHRSNVSSELYTQLTNNDPFSILEVKFDQFHPVDIETDQSDVPLFVSNIGKMTKHARKSDTHGE